MPAPDASAGTSRRRTGKETRSDGDVHAEFGGQAARFAAVASPYRDNSFIKASISVSFPVAARVRTSFTKAPQSWEYYRMEATGPMQNWWLAYKWYQSKNSGSGQNPPLQASQLTSMRHGSHKIRVQGHGGLTFYPIP
jgi:hypothetical protein